MKNQSPAYPKNIAIGSAYKHIMPGGKHDGVWWKTR